MTEAQIKELASARVVIRHVLVSLECTAAWLENDCDPKEAAAEIRLNIANLRKIKDPQ